MSPAPSLPRLFCFGLGYSALALARLLADRGFVVAGTTRDPGKRDALRAEGFEAHLFDGRRSIEHFAEVFAGTTHVLSSIPPGEAGDPVLTLHGRDLARADGLVWSGYLSTTGVYGDHHGEWVDEASAITPTTERGVRRAEAEANWLALGLPLHLFRLAGIYGPGRNAVAQLMAGTARCIHKPGQVFSRIHVTDIAATLLASIKQPHPGAAYNVCDDLPAPPWEVIEYAAALIGVPPPPLIPFEEAELSPMAKSFFSDSKRVSNRRIRMELAVDLSYPTYREGLASLAAGEPLRAWP